MFNSVRLEFFSGDLDSLLVEVEGVKVAMWTNGPDEAVGQRSTSGSTLDHC
jgi:hypothetical protein